MQVWYLSKKHTLPDTRATLNVWVPLVEDFQVKIKLNKNNLEVSK